MFSQFRSLGPDPEKDLHQDDDAAGGPLHFRLILGPPPPAATTTTSSESDDQLAVSGIFPPISQDSSSTSSPPHDRRIHPPKEEVEESLPVQQQLPDHQPQEIKQEGDGANFCLPNLAVKLPPSGSGQGQDEDGARTPTSPRCRIPSVMTTCPPAPRKPKSRPVTTRRKLTAARRVLFVDLNPDDIGSLFSPRPPAADDADDDLHSGGSFKKARHSI